MGNKSNNRSLLFCDIYECLDTFNRPSLEYNTIESMKDYICRIEQQLSSSNDIVKAQQETIERLCDALEDATDLLQGATDGESGSYMLDNELKEYRALVAEVRKC